MTAVVPELEFSFQLSTEHTSKSQSGVYPLERLEGNAFTVREDYLSKLRAYLLSGSEFVGLVELIIFVQHFENQTEEITFDFGNERCLNMSKNFQRGSLNLEKEDFMKRPLFKVYNKIHLGGLQTKEPLDFKSGVEIYVTARAHKTSFQVTYPKMVNDLVEEIKKVYSPDVVGHVIAELQKDLEEGLEFGKVVKKHVQLMIEMFFKEEELPTKIREIVDALDNQLSDLSVDVVSMETTLKECYEKVAASEAAANLMQEQVTNLSDKQDNVTEKLQIILDEQTVMKSEIADLATKLDQVELDAQEKFNQMLTSIDELANKKAAKVYGLSPYESFPKETVEGPETTNLLYQSNVWPLTTSKFSSVNAENVLPPLAGDPTTFDVFAGYMHPASTIIVMKCDDPNANMMEILNATQMAVAIVDHDQNKFICLDKTLEKQYADTEEKAFFNYFDKNTLALKIYNKQVETTKTNLYFMLKMPVNAKITFYSGTEKKSTEFYQVWPKEENRRFYGTDAVLYDFGPAEIVE